MLSKTCVFKPLQELGLRCSIMISESTIKQPAYFSTKLSDELDNSNKTWSSGPYCFFLRRTSSFYNRMKVAERRKEVEALLNLSLPELDDILLESLYKKVTKEYLRKLDKCQQNGFQMTSFERTFLNTFKKLQETTAKLNGVEIVPFIDSLRIPVGPYLPDFLIFGISPKGYSCIAIEINGGCHIYKSQNDFSKENHLHKLGIYTIPIQNPQAGDYSFIKAVFESPKLVNISKRLDQKMHLLRRIWAKTIVNHWKLDRIEMELKQMTGYDYLLRRELELLKKHPTCPKEILKEWKALNQSSRC